MPKPTLKVEPVPGELLRFRIDSESVMGRQYLVDLQANNLNGWCSCDDWEGRRGKILRENEGRPGDASRCKHIRAVREWLLNRFLAELVHQTGMVEEKF